MKKNLVCQEEFDHNMWCVLPIMVGVIYRIDGLLSQSSFHRRHVIKNVRGHADES